MNVKTVLCNKELDEKTYMDQPIEFEVKGQEYKVCKLKRCIYGSKQSFRQSFQLMMLQ